MPTTNPKKSYDHDTKKNQYSKIYEFSLADVDQASHNQTIKAVNTSSGTYFSYYENTFEVLPDAKTLLAVNGEYGWEKLMVEDISSPEGPAQLFEQSGYIYCILYRNSSLFVGDHSSALAEYRHLHGGQFQHEHTFRELGVGYVWSVCLLGDLAVVGGGMTNRHIALIDLKNRQLLAQPVLTAVEKIFSLQVCRLSRSRLLLTVVGTYSPDRGDHTDLFDVSQGLSLGLVGDFEGFSTDQLVRQQTKKIKRLSKQHDSSQQELVELRQKNKKLRRQIKACDDSKLEFQRFKDDWLQKNKGLINDNKGLSDQIDRLQKQLVDLQNKLKKVLAWKKKQQIKTTQRNKRVEQLRGNLQNAESRNQAMVGYL